MFQNLELHWQVFTIYTTHHNYSSSFSKRYVHDIAIMNTQLSLNLRMQFLRYIESLTEYNLKSGKWNNVV